MSKIIAALFFIAAICLVAFLGFFVSHAHGQNIQNIPTPSLWVGGNKGRTNVLQDEFSVFLVDESKGQNLLPEK